MSAAAEALDAAGEAAWARLSRRLGQLQGFGYIVLFVADPTLLAPFKARLSAWLAARHWPWAEVGEAAPASLAERSMQAVFDAAGAVPPPRLVWLEAQRGAGQGAWERARTELLSRLNERRGRLEAELPGALVLVLPDGAQRAAAALAPDLWHVRSLGLSLSRDAGAGPAAPSARLPAASALPTSDAAGASPVALDPPDGLGGPVYAEATPRAAGFDAAEAQDWLQRWTRLHGDRPVESLPLQDEALLALTLPDGLRAQAALAGLGRLDEALDLGAQLVRLARHRQQQGPGLLDIAAGRDLAMALMQWAETLHRAGRAPDALAASREAVVVCRTLVERLGETPAALRDLARALDHLARLARHQGAWREAAEASEACLDQCRTIALRHGETPDTLRAVAQALDHVGLVAQSQGDWNRAGLAFEECLSILQVVDHRLGGSPRARQDLAAALDRIGRVAEALGDWARGAEAYDEAMQLRQPLAARPDDRPPSQPQAGSPSP